MLKCSGLTCTVHILHDAWCNGPETKTQTVDLENHYIPNEDPVCSFKTEFSENTNIPSLSIHREAPNSSWFHTSEHVQKSKAECH